MQTERLPATKTSGRAIQGDLVRRVREGWVTNRADAARILGIAPSTVGDYVTRLVESDILREGPVTSGRVGRPQYRLELNREAGQFVGVDFEANSLMAQVVDFSCQPLYRERRELGGGRVSAARMLEELESLTASVIGEASGQVLGLGVGVPGLVDERRGLGLDYPLIEGWKEVDLRGRLEARFDLDVRIDNTGRVGARAEKLFGGARRMTDFACVVNRGGLGIGAYEAGRLLTGFGGAFGEFGRVAMPGTAGISDGGHLEEAASYRALFGSFGQGERDPDWEGLGERIYAGEAEAAAAFERAVGIIGWVLGLAAAMLNPKAIFLQSPMVGLGERFRARLQAKMAGCSGLPAAYIPRLEFSDLGYYAGAMGAAAMAVESWEPSETAGSADATGGKS